MITYKLNNQGFRHDQDYNWTPSYAFFGSSALFGIGVKNTDILVSQFDNSQNYGIAGEYLNQDSVTNLENFLNSKIYNDSVKLIFFWVERTAEDIDTLIDYVYTLNTKVLHISQGNKYTKTINLMPQIDTDASNTHPGPGTQLIWAKSIKLLLNDRRS